MKRTHIFVNNIFIITSFVLLLAFIIAVPFLSKNEKAYADSNSYEQNLELLARAVNGEARGEIYEGQGAVAAVILNRVKHPSFPNTIAGVIYQPGAFTAVTDGQIHAALDKNSTVYKACQDALNGWDPSGGAIYYYNPAKTTNKWIYSRPVVKVLGNHTFAK